MLLSRFVVESRSNSRANLMRVLQGVARQWKYQSVWIRSFYTCRSSDTLSRNYATRDFLPPRATARIDSVTERRVSHARDKSTISQPIPHQVGTTKLRLCDGDIVHGIQMPRCSAHAASKDQVLWPPPSQVAAGVQAEPARR